MLCCLGLSKITCKLSGRKGTVAPGRAFAANGFGPDGSNWQRIQDLRQSAPRYKASKDWLATGGDSDGLEMYQERNKKALEVINRLGGGEQKAVWLELNKLTER